MQINLIWHGTARDCPYTAPCRATSSRLCGPVAGQHSCASFGLLCGITNRHHSPCTLVCSLLRCQLHRHIFARRHFSLRPAGPLHHLHSASTLPSLTQTSLQHPLLSTACTSAACTLELAGRRLLNCTLQHLTALCSSHLHLAQLCHSWPIPCSIPGICCIALLTTAGVTPHPASSRPPLLDLLCSSTTKLWPRRDRHLPRHRTQLMAPSCTTSCAATSPHVPAPLRLLLLGVTMFPRSLPRLLFHTTPISLSIASASLPDTCALLSRLPDSAASARHPNLYWCLLHHHHSHSRN